MSNYRLNSAKEAALISWVSTAMGITAIWDKQDVKGSNYSQRPELPYATLNIISGPRKEGQADSSYKSGDTYYYKRRKLFTLSINIYARDLYLELIEKLEDSIDHPTVLQSLRANDLWYQTNSDITDVSELLETGNEFRAQMDFIFAYAERTEDETGIIEKTEIDYDYDSGRLKGTKTVEV